MTFRGRDHVFAVFKVNNNSLEFNLPALYPKLEGAKRFAVVHENPIVINLSVDISSVIQKQSGYL